MCCRSRWMTVCATLALVANLGAARTQAQMGDDKPPVPVGQLMEPSKALDEMLTMFEGEALGVAKAMPADKYSFAPSAADFTDKGVKFEGVRTFAGQVAHVAQANYYFFSTIADTKPDVDMRAIGKLTNKDECVKALADSFAFGHRALQTIKGSNAWTYYKGLDGLHTRASVAAFAVAHGFDHYGQMVVYLRMNGVVPPGSK